MFSRGKISFPRFSGYFMGVAMLHFHPESDMNFNDALNSALDVAQHAAGVPVYMEFAGIQFHLVCPPRHVAPRVFSSAMRLSTFSNDSLISEIRHRLKHNEEFYQDFIRALSDDVARGIDKIIRETAAAKFAMSNQDADKFAK